MSSFRRTVRNTRELVSMAFNRLNGFGFELERHKAPIAEREIDDVVRAVLEVGRRRGRAELALELAKRLGLDRELDIALRPMTAPPNLRETNAGASIVQREVKESDGAPIHAPREIAQRIRSRFKRS